MKDDTMNITVRQLRKLLFELANQEMTVRELRQSLFDVNNQEAHVTEENIDEMIEVER